jgi:signal transduction protein with GAF and PtsI domain
MKSQTPTAGVEYDLARKVQQLERQLSEAHQREAATAEVLKVISRSALDVQSVLDRFVKELGRFELGETSGLQEEVVAKFRKLDIATGQTGLGEAIANRQLLQVPQVIKRPSNPLRDATLEAGLHAALIVPLLGSEGALGALVLQRRGIGEFSPSVVMQKLRGPIGNCAGKRPAILTNRAEEPRT